MISGNKFKSIKVSRDSNWSSRIQRANNFATATPQSLDKFKELGVLPVLENTKVAWGRPVSNEAAYVTKIVVTTVKKSLLKKALR